MIANHPTVDSIQNLTYTDFIALIKETNRCPGGKDTIRKIVQNSFIDSNSLVLDVGSNTGFTSLEIAHISKASVFGIDISESCVHTAKDLLYYDLDEIKNRVSFQVGSAYEIPFEDAKFDLVVTGGATSFMDKKQQAISEYKRVLKPWGFLSATQLFYKEVPPQEVIDSVSNAIGVRIQPWVESDWKKIFLDSKDINNLELYYYETNELQSRPEIVINDYIEYFMNKPHIQKYSPEIQDAIRKKWRMYINIFNENHKYLNYFLALFRKPIYPEEPELFIRK